MPHVGLSVRTRPSLRVLSLNYRADVVRAITLRQRQLLFENHCRDGPGIAVRQCQPLRCDPRRGHEMRGDQRSHVADEFNRFFIGTAGWWCCLTLCSFSGFFSSGLSLSGVMAGRWVGRWSSGLRRMSYLSNRSIVRSVGGWALVWACVTTGSGRVEILLIADQRSIFTRTNERDRPRRSANCLLLKITCPALTSIGP